MTYESPVTQLSMPNALVWDYFHIVELAVIRCREATSERIIRQEAATAVVMSVTSVEVFLNLYFRVLVEEVDFIAHKDFLLKCLMERKSLDFKLKKWPIRILGKSMETDGAYQKFQDLKELRNSIVHFTSSHESFSVPGTNIMLQGLADSSEYANLNIAKANDALTTARAVVELIFRLRGTPLGGIGNLMHGWYGLPINKQNQADA